MTGEDRSRGVLWVADEVPDIDGSGGCVRQFHLLTALADAMPVDLLLAADAVPDEVRAAVREVRLVGAPSPPPQDRPLLAMVTGLLDPWPEEVRGGAPARERLIPALAARAPHDVVVVEHTWLAPIVPPRRRSGERWLLEMHNVPSRKAGHALETTTTHRGRLWLHLDRRRARSLERRAAARCDAIVVPSQADAEALSGGNVHVVGNGVDPARFEATPLPDGERAVFTGHLAYPPNVDAVTWFVREVWPHVRRRRPAAVLDLVGFDPDRAVARLDGNDGVEVHADVATVVPFLRRARVAVVPLRIGSGTRLKALEALACARPVVGTSVGLEGLDLEDGTHARIVDDAEGMARAVADLLEGDDAARRLGETGRRHVLERFAWEPQTRRFVEVVTGLAGHAAGR